MGEFGMFSFYSGMAGIYLVRVLAAVLILFFGNKLAKWLSARLVGFLETKQVDITLCNFLKSISYYVLLVAVVIAALNQIGVNTTSFLAVLGAAGLAVGLALKNSLSNFASGVMLIFFQPFKVGDFVTTAGVSGTVKDISIFSTELCTPDNQKLVIPNASVFNNVITNISANPTRRVDLVFGISYEDDIIKAKQIISDIIAADERALKDPVPMVAVSELADSSVNIIARPWAASADVWPLRFALIEKVKIAFDEQGISIPYPQRDVHIYNKNKES